MWLYARMHPSLRAFPDEFLNRLQRIVPPGLVREVGIGFQGERPTTFRVNSLKARPSDVIRDLGKSGLVSEEVRGFAGTFVLKKGSFKKLTESRSYEEGWIYLQSLSSQIPPLVLSPLPGETVLDLAAAPGGKTCQMAAFMENRGEIVAIEPDQIRCERLQFNVEKQGAKIATVVRARGEKCVGEEFEGRFDRVLIDAPCSSEGTFLAGKRATFSHWSEVFVRDAAKLQKKLIAAALRCVKPGGLVAYSTCALSPEENECVIDAALSDHPGTFTEEIPLKFPFLRPPLASWDGAAFFSGVRRARRIYPSSLTEGFFVALLRRPG
jgi:16S rRNA (cytosine1407-C5)-methyltransferase